ncbi:MAG: 4-(cytidine 5'-diphospho)-2-C-methyl-D-erythritol kinase [Candidatus Delongbacteria bacterium]
MKFKANCKINLHLAVTGKLSDGYHSIKTIFQEIPFSDELDIETADENEITFSAEGITIPSESPDNICVKAAEILKERYSVTKGCRIKLKKNIPVGAGLGGGSSDAATVLKALNMLWNIDLSAKKIRSIGSELGADVPFFIDGGCAWAEGRGDILRPVKPVLQNGFILLVYPSIHISTRWAYKNLNLNLTKTGDMVIFAEVSKLRTAQNSLIGKFSNDFESVVFKKYPEIGRIKELMLNKGADFSAMSGSGSTVFGFFLSERALKNSLKNLDKNYFIKAIKL